MIDNDILSYGTQQVAKICIRYIMFCMFVCGNVNRRHHVVETIHNNMRSHTLFFAEDITEYTSRKLARNGGRLGAWVSFCFRGFLLSGKL